MKNFTYRSHEEKENIEEILRQRKRKINRQQIVAGSVLGVLLWHAKDQSQTRRLSQGNVDYSMQHCH